MRRHHTNRIYTDSLTAAESFDAFRCGLITRAELTAYLENLQIRGGIEGGRFTGYDYNRQEWLTANELFEPGQQSLPGVAL